MRSSRIARAPIWCAVALGIAGIHTLAAQTLAWQVPIYAAVPPFGSIRPHEQIAERHERAGLADSPFLTRSDPDSRTVLVSSTAGEPGLVLVGRAQTAKDNPYVQSTPWIAKISTDDGRQLWTWHLPFDNAIRGGFKEAAVDGLGDIVAIGTQSYAESTSGFLLMKLDGADGEPLWRVDGPPGFRGYGVLFESNGNVAMTASSDTEQIVAKYAGIDGELLWSASLADASTEMSDFQIAADAAGNLLIAGQCYDRGNAEYGIQIGKFRGVDGALLWSRRFFSGASFMSAVDVLEALPDGDALLIGSLGEPGSFARLAGDTGATKWQRDDVGWSAISIDAQGQILVGGFVQNAADLQRIDAATGQTLWRRELPGIYYTSIRSLALGIDGNPIIALSEGDEWIPFETVGLELGTGQIRWMAAMRQDGYVTEDDFPVGILQSADGSVFFGGLNHDLPGDATSTIFKLAPIAKDTIFMNGCD